MSARPRFAHPDEEATFNRSRVYYFGEDLDVRIECEGCGGKSIDSEPRGDDHHAAFDALWERLASAGWSAFCGRYRCPTCAPAGART